MDMPIPISTATKLPMRDAQTELPAIQGAFPGELMIWLSASFPVGGFAYSQGLETAAEKGWVSDRGTLAGWLDAVLRHGALGNDLILISLVMRAGDIDELQALLELSVALQPSAERNAEAITQGRSFTQAYDAAWREGSAALINPGQPVTLPVAFALAAHRHDVPLPASLEAYAIAFLTNLVSAAIRLSIIGQFDGQRVLADLLPTIRSVCAGVLSATEEDLGTATYGADLAAILHETQRTRLFRS